MKQNLVITLLVVVILFQFYAMYLQSRSINLVTSKSNAWFKGKQQTRTKPEALGVAKTWVNNYRNSDLYPELSADSYLIDIDSVNKYYPLATFDLKYYHLFIAFKRPDDISTMTLVLEGVDRNGRHVRFPYNGQPDYVLEHCIPCPECFDEDDNLEVNQRIDQ